MAKSSMAGYLGAGAATVGTNAVIGALAVIAARTVVGNVPPAAAIDAEARRDRARRTLALAGALHGSAMLALGASLRDEAPRYAGGLAASGVGGFGVALAVLWGPPPPAELVVVEARLLGDGRAQWAPATPLPPPEPPPFALPARAST